MVHSTHPASSILGRFWDGFQWVDTDPRGGDRTTAGSQQTTRTDRFPLTLSHVPFTFTLTLSRLAADRAH